MVIPKYAQKDVESFNAHLNVSDRVSYATFLKRDHFNLRRDFCFGSLMYPYPKNTPIKYFWISTSHYHTTTWDHNPDICWSNWDQDKYIKYINWLLNDSTWADAFVCKDAQEFYECGSFMDVSYPASYVMQAAILTKYPLEQPLVYRFFMDNMDDYPPHIVLIAAHARKTTSHRAMNTLHNTTKEVANNIVTNNRSHFKNYPSFRENNSYTPTYRIWMDRKMSRGQKGRYFPVWRKALAGSIIDFVAEQLEEYRAQVLHCG